MSTAAILEAFADEDLATKNHAAAPSGEAASMEAHRRRLGHVLACLADELAETHEEWRRSMLRELGVSPSGHVDTEDLAMELLGISLDRLRRPLRALSRAQHQPGKACTLLHHAACCAWVCEKPWVAVDGAALFARERDTPQPRIVHIPCSEHLTLQLYVRRAATRAEWRMVPLAASDGETDPETGLPTRLLQAIRAELLQNVAPVDPDDAENVRDIWERKHAKALENVSDIVLVLPADASDLDATFFEQLKASFPSCVFAMSSREPPRGIKGSRLLVSLTESLGQQDEEKAAEDFTDQVQALGERVAGGGWRGRAAGDLNPVDR
ncbi:hypothetical protein [Streptomyces glaucescens]|nr:hypothetical protein [Streptomyces glaucescens]